MTGQSGPDEPDEPEAPTITWHQVVVPDLLEARITTGDDGDGGEGLYAGYVARSPGDNEWRGYIGLTHTLVALGTRDAVQAAVEQAAREAWATRRRPADGERGVDEEAPN